MDRKLIRLTIAEPAGDPEKECAEFREFIEKIRPLLADSGVDLQVAFREGAGYDRIMLRLTRNCPEEIARADLALFLFPRKENPFLSAEYEIACNQAGSGGRPVCVRVVLSWQDPRRVLMDELAELDPSLPVLAEENGCILIGGTEVLPKEPPHHSWLDDDLYGARCPICGGILRRYDDWFVCESCKSIG